VPCPNTRLARGPKFALVPTLAKELPIPIHKIIGDLSDEQRVPSNLKVE
jgi:circadian clock protein KaiB